MHRLRRMIGLFGAQLLLPGCADVHIDHLSPGQSVVASCTPVRLALGSLALHRPKAVARECPAGSADHPGDVALAVSPQGTVQSPIIRDSAGVRIIENGARMDAPIRFALGARPAFEVGGLEDSESTEFNHTAGYLNGVRLSDGRFAVIDVNRIHYFDSRARRIRVVGRNGSGPEEFRYLTALCRTTGDTLVVVDSHNGRLAIIDSKGNVSRTFPTGDTRSLGSGSCLGDGSMVVVRPIGGGIARDRRGRLMRLRLDGTTANVIGEVILHPVSLVTQVVPHVATFRQKVFFGDGAAGQVLVFNATGSLSGIIRTRTEGSRFLTQTSTSAYGELTSRVLERPALSLECVQKRQRNGRPFAVSLSTRMADCGFRTMNHHAARIIGPLSIQTAE